MILDKIVKDKLIRLKEQKEKVDESTMELLAKECKRETISFSDALSKPGISIIGEFKKASPSKGKMNNKISLIDRIGQYNQVVDAISCLTEENHFHGSIEYLKEIRGKSDLPIIRKDFIIDAYQIYEAKVIGADAILLIAAILEQDELEWFHQLAYSLGLDVLLEVHDEEELRRALKIQANIIGVNNRNLKDFTIDLHTTEKLAKIIEQEATYKPILVSESGVTQEEHVRFLKKSNVDALLIGTAFMEAENPKQLAKQWKAIE